jgi:hypothetical protein
MCGMRRTLGSVGAWLLATGLAVLVSWLGVQSVRFAAVPDRVSPMSAAEARRVAPKSGTPAPAPAPTSDAPSPSVTPSVRGSVSATATPGDASGSPTPSETWTPIPDGKGGTALLRTITVQGGSARLRFADNDVRVISTQPATGFRASFDQKAPGQAVVTFTSPGHTSTITAYWERGARAQVSETPSQQ